MLMPTRALPATMHSLSSSSRKDPRDDAERPGVLELLQQLPALLRAGMVDDDRADVADVGVDRVARA